MDEAVRISSLYGGYKEKLILKDINLEFQKGTFTALCGPNGAGKSTLLKYLIKELKPQSGEIHIFGKDIRTYKQKELAQKLSFVGQNTRTEYEFTVEQLVSLGRFCHDERTQNSEIAVKAMEKCGILHLKDKLVTRISGGEMQLAMLSRALCQDTEMIILDEPVNNLDPAYQIRLMNILKSLSAEGKAVVAVLHDLSLALNWSENAVIIKDGSVFAYGRTQNVITEENIRGAYGLDCTISLASDRITKVICYNPWAL